MTKAEEKSESGVDQEGSTTRTEAPASTVLVPIRVDGAIRPLDADSQFTLVEPKVLECRVCGSTADLYPDPAGYYVHATTADGYWLCHGDGRMTPEQKVAHRREGETVR